jgi:hypothetical protein
MEASLKRLADHASRPGGRRAGGASFSDRAMEGESENPGCGSIDRFASSGKAFFFGSFLLGRQKK